MALNQRSGGVGGEKTLSILLGEETKNSTSSKWRGTSADSVSEGVSAPQGGNAIWVDVLEDLAARTVQELTVTELELQLQRAVLSNLLDNSI